MASVRVSARAAQLNSLRALSAFDDIAELPIRVESYQLEKNDREYSPERWAILDALQAQLEGYSRSDPEPPRTAVPLLYQFVVGAGASRGPAVR